MTADLRRSLWPAALAVLLLAAIALTMSAQDVRIPPKSAVLELWSDLARDVDRISRFTRRVEPAREQAIGDSLAGDLNRSLPKGSAYRAQRYLEAVGNELVAVLTDNKLTYSFRVVIDPDVVNAFALPGGHIYITTGLLDLLGSEAELAAILGHEISHVSLGHCIALFQSEWPSASGGGASGGISGLMRTVLAGGFASGEETDADLNGVLIAARAGYDPRAALTAMQILARLEDPGADEARTAAGEVGLAVKTTLEALRQSHPSAEARLLEIEQLIERNSAEWSGRRFYVGKASIETLIARSAGFHPDEWTPFVP